MAARQKIVPWETHTDGEWHQVRTGPTGESKAESLRAYRNHAASAREWAARNGYRAQISRRENGRILSVRLTRPAGADNLERLRQMSRNELGQSLVQAIKLLNYAFHLRVHGENAPGGSETWAQFDRNAETFLRKIQDLP